MQFQAFDAVVDPTNVAVVTTTEKVIISSNAIPMEYQTANVLIIGWCQFTTGTNCTTVAPKIRRGTGITGTLVNEANAETILATAGSTEPYFCMATDVRAGENQLQYSFTLTQAGADGNGNALQAGIVVIVF